ncbi:CASP-like protein 5A3 [Lolium rigidum]|uniref:CASP-like protein 5A3 n=1 Tax=Lolium rigidum TaxID=89674 RepID=UPI001F5DD7ED|nr:CASP-like protein 5A3 [Lolium rigidum]
MMPQASHPLVHPDPAPVVEPPAPAALQVQGPAPAPAAPPAQGQGNANAPPGVLMRSLPGAPGTRTGLGLRLAQAALAAAALGAMVSTGDDYRSVTGFRYFVPAVALQCMWSLAMATVDVYAILVGRSFRTPRVVSILSAGDWITGALTFSAASAAAGITVLINADLDFCDDNHCPNFMSATAMAFLSSFVIAPCCILNLGQMIYKLQRP